MLSEPRTTEHNWIQPVQSGSLQMWCRLKQLIWPITIGTGLQWTQAHLRTPKAPKKQGKKGAPATQTLIDQYIMTPPICFTYFSMIIWEHLEIVELWWRDLIQRELGADLALTVCYFQGIWSTVYISSTSLEEIWDQTVAPSKVCQGCFKPH